MPPIVLSLTNTITIISKESVPSSGKCGDGVTEVATSGRAWEQSPVTAAAGGLKQIWTFKRFVGVMFDVVLLPYDNFGGNLTNKRFDLGHFGPQSPTSIHYQFWLICRIALGQNSFQIAQVILLCGSGLRSKF